MQIGMGSQKTYSVQRRRTAYSDEVGVQISGMLTFLVRKQPSQQDISSLAPAVISMRRVENQRPA